jgi:hypothetical protein
MLQERNGEGTRHETKREQTLLFFFSPEKHFQKRTQTFPNESDAVICIQEL